MPISGLTLAEIEQLGPGHDYINLSFHELADEDLDALGEAIRDNRSMSSIHLLGNPFSAEATARFSGKVLAADNRNLVHLTLNDIPPALQSLIDRNQNHCRALIDGMQNGIERLDGAQLRDIARHWRGISYKARGPEKPLLISCRSLLSALPPEPRKNSDTDYSEALFTADGQGFSPLDNPDLWQDAAQALSALDRVPLTQRFLSRETEKGSTLLQAAFHAIPAGQLLSYLDERGVHLNAARLLDKAGAPSPLLNGIEYQRNGLEELFRPEYWLGRQAEADKVFKALPEHAQARVPIQSMRLETRLPSMTAQTR